MLGEGGKSEQCLEHPQSGGAEHPLRMQVRGLAKSRKKLFHILSGMYVLGLSKKIGIFILNYM